jgi:hypothetical protein
MDIPRIASPSSSRVLDQMSYHDRRPPISRNDSQTSSSFHTSRAPMTIPHNRPAEAPPPLPPPRFIEDLANGHDLGWRWGNSVGDGGFGKLAPINKVPASMVDIGGRRWTQVVTKKRWKGWMSMATLIEEAAQYQQFGHPHIQKSFPGAWVTFSQVARERLPRQQSPIKGWRILPFLNLGTSRSVFTPSPTRRS